ncbi:hypothetical protein ACFZB9_14600 [Kitasatospora sp. NPDC008050]|uniref:hypothetical protein n=1 Tax=Kitasatospora sp. NPDC008050 TaxID=3364021 RepID=UPI0036E0AD82
MTRHQRAVVAVCLAGAAALLATTASTLTAGAADTTATPSPSASAQPTQAATPPPAVEDYSYPGADRLLREQGLVLKRGDGHIVLADCASTPEPDLKVVTGTSTSGSFCFRVTGTTGYLALEIKDVFALQTRSHPIRATLTPTGQSQTQVVDVAKNQYAPVGEGANPNNAPTVLVELRATG